MIPHPSPIDNAGRTSQDLRIKVNWHKCACLCDAIAMCQITIHAAAFVLSSMYIATLHVFTYVV